MSRTATKIALAFIDLITAPLQSRQRDKTLGRIAAALAERGSRPLDTGRGQLKVFALRGPYIASSVANFKTEEPDTLWWIDTVVGDGETLWDIGACVGLYSMYAAQKPGVKVIAFEPKAWNFGTLVEHIEANGMGDRILPLCVALGERTELTQIQLSSLMVGGAGNSLKGETGQFGYQESVFNQGVPAFRIDDLVKLPGASAPDHIKLDVDGIEGLILRGGPETLKGVKTVLIEVEGENATNAEARLEAPLAEAGLFEDMAFRETWKGGRNRLYRRR